MDDETAATIDDDVQPEPPPGLVEWPITPGQRNGAPEVMPPPLCEDAMALEFSRRCGDDWRYISAWGKWLHWDEEKWAKDTTQKIEDITRRICRDIDFRNPKADDSVRGLKFTTAANVERFLRSDRRHAATVDQWDLDPWILNTPCGIVDLRTGEIGPHQREAMATKITRASPSDADCPRWLSFLHEVTDNDDDLSQYLARVAGYMLTGTTVEHALFFCYGTGGNGKGKFVNTLASILGDYASVAPMETFLESKMDRHPTELAGLQGARLVTSGEIDKGRRWAEAKIKQLTGGDPITARYMCQNFFTYKPQFKLLIAGNNKPAIRDVDEAIRRRMHLIPFNVTFRDQKRDEFLEEKLYAERDGILQWAIDGCLDWQRGGLRPPDCVMEATDKYLASEDAIGRWLAEKCTLDASADIEIGTLYAAWKIWAETNGEFSGSLRRLSDDLDKRGFKRFVGNSRRGFQGIILTQGADDEDWAARESGL